MKLRCFENWGPFDWGFVVGVVTLTCAVEIMLALR
jgi:hypothetical protein